MNTENTTAKGAKPTHRIYVVTGEAEKSNWTAIGAAWPNKDGQGFNINFEAFPISGRIVMREIIEKSELADTEQEALV